MDKLILKRLEQLEKKYREVEEDLKSRNYLSSLVVRSKDEIQKHDGKIGPHTNVIYIRARNANKC